MEKIHQLKTCFCIVFSSSIFMKYFNQYFCLRQLGDSLTVILNGNCYWHSGRTSLRYAVHCRMFSTSGPHPLSVSRMFLSYENQKCSHYFKMGPRATTTFPSFPIKNILVMFLTRVDGFSKYFPCCMVNDSLEKF